MTFRSAFHLTIPAALAAATALGGCAALDESEPSWADDPGEDAADVIRDEGLHLVAVADRANGNQLRFYEPLPGSILTVELGQGPTMARASDAIALFRAAAPDAAVPAELTQAAQRAANARPTRAIGVQPESGLSVPADQAVDRVPADKALAPAAANPCEINTFIANECTDGTQEWCKINWWNGFYAYNTTVNSMHNAVCSLTGTVTLRLLINSVPKADFDIAKNHIGKVVWVNLSSNFGFYTQVTNASGDMFHVGGAATNL